MDEGVSYRGRLRQRTQRKSYVPRDSDFDDSEDEEQIAGDNSGSDDDFQGASVEDAASVADEDFNEEDDDQKSIEDDLFSEDGVIEDDTYESRRKTTRGSGKNATPSKGKMTRPSIKERSKPSDLGTEYDSTDSDKNRFTMVYGTNADTIEAAIRMADIFRADISGPRHSHLSFSLFFKPWIEKQEETESTFEKEKGQVIRDLAMNDPSCERYFPGSNKTIVSLLLGSLHGNEGQKSQKLFKLSRFSFVSLNAPNVFPEKRGFVMNVGDCVTALEWATRKPEGNQYLAVVTLPKGVAVERTPNVPPGFARCRQPASLQIWQFSAIEPAPGLPKASLHLVLAFDWGAIVDMQWQPGTFSTSAEDIGLLLAVFEDGCARVIKIRSRQRNQSPILKVEAPLFEMRLADTIITACSWIGHHKVIFGCANGMAALYDLNIIRPESAHVPVMYYPVHSTYISRIVHMIPSMPYHVATVGADGNFSFHDIRDPQSSKLMSQQKYHRAVDTAGLVWHDRTLSLIYTDGTKFNSIYPVRRLGRRMKIIEGTTEALAASTGGGGSHPFIASGTSDGKVLVVNPHQKIAATNRDTSKLRLYEQIWFTIEYSRKSAVYRMQDEFPLEQKNTLNEMSEKFYLPEVYIRKVCWNPNKAYGSWCAAGTGGGLVRIENIALDVHESLDPSKEVQEAETFRKKLQDTYEELQRGLIERRNNSECLIEPDSTDTNEEQRVMNENGTPHSQSAILETDIGKSQEDPISEVQRKIVNQLRNLHSPIHSSSHIATENRVQVQHQQQDLNLENKQPTKQQQQQQQQQQRATRAQEQQESGADGTQRE